MSVPGPPEQTPQPGTWPPPRADTPERNMGPDRKWHHTPWKEHDVRQEVTDRHFWKHYLPFRSVIKKYVVNYAHIYVHMCVGKHPSPRRWSVGVGHNMKRWRRLSITKSRMTLRNRLDVWHTTNKNRLTEIDKMSCGDTERFSNLSSFEHPLLAFSKVPLTFSFKHGGVFAINPPPIFGTVRSLGCVCCVHWQEMFQSIWKRKCISFNTSIWSPTSFYDIVLFCFIPAFCIILLFIFSVHFINEGNKVSLQLHQLGP